MNGTFLKMVSNNSKEFLLRITLPLICLISLYTALPAINSYLVNPNFVVYSNPDAGGLMDLIWSYYSGEKRDSFQWDFDYGLEMVYLSDFSRFVLSHFISITPITLLLLLRWFHLIAWIGALMALWRLISRHFSGEGWQPLLAVTLLAVRPVFPYFMQTPKPEPLVLFFVITGLDYTLRLIEYPILRNLVAATGCASCALIIKFAGIFLLPPVVISLCFSKRYHQSNPGRQGLSILDYYSNFTWAYLLPSFLGMFLIGMPLICLLFYVRKSTGHTWVEEFGVLGSVHQNKAIIFLWTTGAVLMFLSFFFWALARKSGVISKRILAPINEINSFTFLTCSVFFIITILLGSRWIIEPRHFINTYSQVFSIAAAPVPEAIELKDFLLSLFENISDKILLVDPVIFCLFIFYLILEIYLMESNLNHDKLQTFKRLVLVVFLIPFFLIMFSMCRLAGHHTILFFGAVLILAIQGVRIFNSTFHGKKLYKNGILALIVTLLLMDIGISGAESLKQSAIILACRNKDIAFEVEKWLLANISHSAPIVAEHYNNNYIPPEFKNVKTFNGSQTNKIEQFQQLVDIHHPEFLYYNETSSDGKLMPPIEEIFPIYKMQLVKSFDGSGADCLRRDGDKFFVYKVSW